MLKNVGLIDRVVRFVVAAVLVAVGIANVSSGLWWLAVVGVVPLVTGALGYCPIWHIVGVNTVKVKKL